MAITDIPGAEGVLGGGGTLVLGILGYLAKQYFDKRSADREDKKQNVESESGIVETTKVTLATVREEIINLKNDRAEDRAKIDALEDKNEDLERKNRKLERRVEVLEEENQELKNGRNAPAWSQIDPNGYEAEPQPRTRRSRGLDGGEATQPGLRPGGFAGGSSQRTRRRHGVAGEEDSARG